VSTWRTLAILTRRELVERGRSRTFLLTAVFTIVLVLAVVLIPALAGGGKTTYTVGVTDTGGRRLLEVAATLDETTHFDVVELGGRTDAEEAVRAGTVEAALLGSDTVLFARAPGQLFGSPLAAVLQEAAATARIESLVEAGGESAAVVDILASEPLTVESLTGSAGNTAGREAFAYGSLFLMYIAVLTYGAWTLTGVTEEKTNRVVEVLLATVRPWQLLVGKVVGIGALGLVQLAVTIGVVVAAIQLTGTADLPDIPLGSAAALLLWFVIGFGLYSVMFAMLGSLVSRPEEAQSASFPVTILVVAAFFASMQALEDPDGTLAVAGTVFPFTAPFVAPVRLALDALPGWQAAIAVVVAVATMYGLIRLAGRIYAGGILRTGGRVKLRDAYRSAEM